MPIQFNVVDANGVQRASSASRASAFTLARNLTPRYGVMVVEKAYSAWVPLTFGGSADDVTYFPVQDGEDVVELEEVFA